MIVSFLIFVHVLYVDKNSSPDFSNVATAQAASQMRVSLLKFEPRVSNFPVIETGLPVSITTATGKVLARVYVMIVSFQIYVIKRHQPHIKARSKKFFVVKVMEARDGFHYR